MDVIHMTLKVAIIDYDVFPKASLPNSPFSLSQTPS